jgi:hypothetical protein
MSELALGRPLGLRDRDMPGFPFFLDCIALRSTIKSRDAFHGLVGEHNLAPEKVSGKPNPGSATRFSAMTSSGKRPLERPEVAGDS